MSAVLISKSPPVAIKPSERVTATGDINLSSYDMWLVNASITVFSVFEHPVQEPVETIKRGLSRALVHYYPIAGRLAAGATAGEVVIKCTADGVSFVAASANCAIKDVQDFSDPSLKEELAMFYPAADGLCRYSDPLVLMQVTVFSCGGFIFGVTGNSGRRALCWMLSPRTMADPEALTVLIIQSNARKYAGAKDGYYGNCVLAQLVTATTGAVANGNIIDIVKMIHGTKDRVPHQSEIDDLLQIEDSYNILSMNSWRNFMIRPDGEGIDFGSGTTARVMGHSRGMTLMPKYTACLPCKGDYHVLSVCVKEDHASAFLQELADTHLVSIRSLL